MVHAPSTVLAAVVASALVCCCCLASLASAGAVCPAGQRPVQAEKALYANGCGVPGLHIQMEGSEFFERPCCDLHDVCYSLCGADFNECEKAFEKCMNKGCNKAGAMQQQCKSAAQTFAMGTRALGQSTFKKTQEEYCQCIDESDEQLIADAYVPHAEKVYRKALGDVEADEKMDNFRSKVLPKYFKNKAEWTVMMNLFERYPTAIDLVDESKGKAGGGGGGGGSTTTSFDL
jgi:hypothetical protein